MRRFLQWLGRYEQRSAVQGPVTATTVDIYDLLRALGSDE